MERASITAISRGWDGLHLRVSFEVGNGQRTKCLVWVGSKD